MRAATASGSARAPRCVELLGDPLLQLLLRDVEGEHLPAFAHAFQSAELDFSSSATSASTVVGAGLARYADDRLDVGRLPAALRRPRSAFTPSTSVTTMSRASPNRLPALQSPTTASPDVSSAVTVSIDSTSKWLRRRAIAVSTFGPSLPVMR